MIEEDGKFYPMIKVIPGGIPVPCENPLYDRFGELLLKGANPVLFRFLEYRKGVLLTIRESACGAEERVRDIDKELADIESAFCMYR